MISTQFYTLACLGEAPYSLHQAADYLVALASGNFVRGPPLPLGRLHVNLCFATQDQWIACHFLSNLSGFSSVGLLLAGAQLRCSLDNSLQQLFCLHYLQTSSNCNDQYLYQLRPILSLFCLAILKWTDLRFPIKSDWDTKGCRDSNLQILGLGMLSEVNILWQPTFIFQVASLGRLRLKCQKRHSMMCQLMSDKQSHNIFDFNLTVLVITKRLLRTPCRSLLGASGIQHKC